jgi:RNA polymerase sigma factor for flagellar operon FliA
MEASATRPQLRTDEEMELWRRARRDCEPAARETLLRHYQDLAKFIAARLYRDRHVHELEFSDYHQYATIGLIESLDRFDPTLGVRFETFAGHRIQGAILNGVEKLSEKQQQIAVRKRLMSERSGALTDGRTHGKGIDAIIAELAEIAIGLAIGYLLEDSGMYFSGDEQTQDHVYASCELKQLKRRLQEVVEKLPAQERNVIKAHYYHGIRFDEIAADMGLSKGRISQIHQRAVNHLRELSGSMDKHF